MRLRYIRTDAGRSKYLPGEKNDCTVRALACALAMSYPEAYNRLAALGRKPKDGFELGPHTEALGLEFRERLSCLRLEQVMPQLGRGRFIIATTNHVFAVVYGTIYDLIVPKARQRVRMVYEAVGVDEGQSLDLTSPKVGV